VESCSSVFVVMMNYTQGSLMDSMFFEMHKALCCRGCLSSLRMAKEELASPPDLILEKMKNRYGSAEFSNIIFVDSNLKIHIQAPFPVKRIRILTDAPYSQIKYFKNIGVSDKITVVDRTHLEILSFLDVKHDAFFLPHAGMMPLSGLPGIFDRDIDILFVGSIPFQPTREMLDGKASFLRAKDLGVSLLRGTAERILEKSQEPFAAFREACDEYSFDLDVLDSEAKFNCCEALAFLSRWCESKKRIDLLKALKSVPVAIVGEIPLSVRNSLGSHHMYYGPLLGYQVLMLMQRAKILLNSVSVFPRGAHERVFYGMACGACVVTDKSEYLKEYYNDNEDLFYFPEDAGVFDDFFIEKLKNLDKLQKITASAVLKYENRDTWYCRSEEVINIAKKDFF